MTEFMLSASKWLKIQVLFETEELAKLLQSLEKFELYRTGRVMETSEKTVHPDQLIESYGQYLTALKTGRLPESADFTLLLTVEPESVSVIPVKEYAIMTQPVRPVIQMQSHRLGYSSVDGKFRPMVFGMDSIFWGLQFSYPQIYEDPDTKDILNVNDQNLFPNTKLFRSIQRWLRANTLPTSFEVDGIVANVPIRIGKQCLKWINRHPQLKQHRIKVSNINHEH